MHIFQHNFMATFVVVIISMVGSRAIAVQPGRAIADEPPSLTGVVAESVLKLSQWPEPLVKTSGQKPDEQLVLENQARDWMSRVLEPTWQPPADSAAYFIPGTRRNDGVLRMKWRCNEHDVELSQTLELFVARVTPLNGKGTGSTADQRLAVAKDIALRLFNTAGKRWGPRRDGAEAPVAVEELARKITTYSFVPETTRRLDDGTLFGRPKTKEEAGINVRSSNQERAGGSSWEDSPAAWNFWFRKVSWWNDGKSVVIFFPKHEGGARSAESR